MTGSATDHRRGVLCDRREGRPHRRASAYRRPRPDRSLRRPSRLSSAEVPASRYAPVPKWWGRDHFLQVALPLAARVRPECLQNIRGGNVDSATFLRWAAAEAAHACSDGTHIVVAATKVAVVLGMSHGTVRRCRVAARRLGVYRVLLRGRPGTLGERVEGLERAGGPRRLANESMFCLPQWLAVALARHHRQRRGRTTACRPAVDHGTPPGGTSLQVGDQGSGFSSVTRRNRFATEAATPPASTRPAGPAPSPLARAITGSDGPIVWLRGCSAARVTPALARFVSQGWTARDLARALAARGWDRPHGRVRYPAGALAWCLRRIDPHADRPSLLDQIDAERRAGERFRAQLDYAAGQARAAEPTPAWHDARRQVRL